VIKQIEKIKARIAELDAERSKWVTALESLQGVCDHDWVTDGHDHNFSYERCRTCGKEREV